MDFRVLMWGVFNECPTFAAFAAYLTFICWESVLQKRRGDKEREREREREPELALPW